VKAADEEAARLRQQEGARAATLALRLDELQVELLSSRPFLGWWLELGGIAE
jgi:hypothetical protein